MNKGVFPGLGTLTHLCPSPYHPRTVDRDLQESISTCLCRRATLEALLSRRYFSVFFFRDLYQVPAVLKEKVQSDAGQLLSSCLIFGQKISGWRLSNRVAYKKKFSYFLIRRYHVSTNRTTWGYLDWSLSTFNVFCFVGTTCRPIAQHGVILTGACPRSMCQTSPKQNDLWIRQRTEFRCKDSAGIQGTTPMFPLIKGGNNNGK